VPDDATTGEPEGRNPRPPEGRSPHPLEGRNPRLRFPKAARLTQTAEFARVRTDGRPVHGKMITLGVLKGAMAEADGRVGIVTSKRVGNAVIRSRVRRRLREIFRAMRPRLIPGLWLVVVAKSPAAKASSAALGAEFTQLAQRGRIFREPAKDVAP
jgi:ribonuclease P protein component